MKICLPYKRKEDGRIKGNYTWKDEMLSSISEYLDIIYLQSAYCVKLQKQWRNNDAMNIAYLKKGKWNSKMYLSGL